MILFYNFTVKFTFLHFAVKVYIFLHFAVKNIHIFTVDLKLMLPTYLPFPEHDY